MSSYDGSLAPPPSAAAVQKSPWHSPVPYLFGGLAAMLGLIAFALLILACSYWKLSGYLEHNAGDGERDLEAGEGAAAGDGNGKPAPPVMEEKYLVIMAGQIKPTFLATPASSRAPSFGSTAASNTSGSSENSSEEDFAAEKKPEDGNRPIELGNLDGRDSAAADQVQ
ncbi:protein GLUTAMINE DUMPER 2-like [Andrographis paniculata]|uniref:protein GLUTAMINE DUMPER 2-like n=1 Tax=Andrographis paniculata TaxID=175694 RepID=UPI0021E7E1FC|nr:protein GLUTAMINE DUMPER 2-like [Andrographis paniculata]